MDFFHIYSISIPSMCATRRVPFSRQGPARACNCVALSCASRRFTCEGCASQLGRCPNSKNISIRGSGGICLILFVCLYIFTSINIYIYIYLYLYLYYIYIHYYSFIYLLIYSYTHLFVYVSLFFNSGSFATSI